MKSKGVELPFIILLAIFAAKSHARTICGWDNPDAAREADWQQDHINALNRQLADITARSLNPARSAFDKSTTDFNNKTKAYTINHGYQSQLQMILGGIDRVEESLAADEGVRTALSTLASAPLAEFEQGLADLPESVAGDDVRFVLKAFESVEPTRIALTEEAKLDFIAAVSGKEMNAIRLGLNISRRSLGTQLQQAGADGQVVDRQLADARDQMARATATLASVQSQVNGINDAIKARQPVLEKALRDRGGQNNCVENPLFPRPT